MHRCYRTADLVEAHLLQGLLATAGIEAKVLNAYAAGAAGELPPGETGPELWVVRAEDIKGARRVLLAYERSGTGAAPRRCPRCAEENPAAFDSCWRCGFQLDKP